jgi:DNA-binding NtrC family response regulator
MHPQAILFVDDNTALANAFQLSLGERGFRVLAAANCDEALHLCDGAGDAPLAVVDLKMPGVDGPGTIAALRERWPELKIIAMSGQRLVPYFSRLSELGVRVFLSKPFSIEALLCGIEELAACRN